MIRALLIYAAAMVAFVVAGTVITNTPLETVAWLVLLVEVVPLATWGAAMSIRRMSRKARQDLTLTCDPVDRLPKQRVTAEIVAPPLSPPAPRVRVEAPQPLQLEAPRREVTKWHNGME